MKKGFSYTVSVVAMLLLLFGCDNNSSSSHSTSEGANFNDSNIPVTQLPIYDSLENAIKVTWYSVEGAAEYEIFWENDGLINSQLVNGTTYQLSTAGYEVFDVWVSALDAEGVVIVTTAKVSMNSKDTSGDEVIFSDVAPSR